MHITCMKRQPKLCLNNTSLGQDHVVSLIYKMVSPIAVHKFLSNSTPTQGDNSAFTFSMHLLQFCITFLLRTFCLLCSYSAAHTQKAQWPWFLCSCFMTLCLELWAPLSAHSHQALLPLLHLLYNTATLPSLFLPSYMCSSFALCKHLLVAHKC